MSVLCESASAPQELGEDLHRTLEALTTEFAKGAVSPALRPVFFGARLIGLLKKDGGFRPIACGDVFRRLATCQAGRRRYSLPGKWA